MAAPDASMPACLASALATKLYSCVQIIWSRLEYLINRITNVR